MELDPRTLASLASVFCPEDHLDHASGQGGVEDQQAYPKVPDHHPGAVHRKFALRLHLGHPLGVRSKCQGKRPVHYGLVE